MSSNWYIVKNMSDWPFEVKFHDGSTKLLIPGATTFWYGPAENDERLQDLIDEGTLDVWKVQFGADGELLEEAGPVNWRSEGF